MAEIVDVKRADAHRAFKLLRDERESQLRCELNSSNAGSALDREADEKIGALTLALEKYRAARIAFDAIALDTSGSPGVLVDASTSSREPLNG